MKARGRSPVKLESVPPSRSTAPLEDSASLPVLTEPQLEECVEILNHTFEQATVPAIGEEIASQSRPAWKDFSATFFSTFFTIFLAELGDKTQLTTLLMAAESHAPWIVFAGAGSALIATSLVGVLVGRWLSQRVSPKTLETCAGVLLLAIALLLLWDVIQG